MGGGRTEVEVKLATVQLLGRGVARKARNAVYLDRIFLRIHCKYIYFSNENVAWPNMCLGRSDMVALLCVSNRWHHC